MRAIVDLAIPTHLVFVDATGITNNLLRRFGRAPRGARVHNHIPGLRWRTITILAALLVTGLTAPLVFYYVNDGDELPGLHRTDLVADPGPRRPRHRRQPRRAQDRRYPASHPGCRGYTDWYLPSYSPDLNRIELLLREAEGSGPHRSLSQHRDALASSSASAWRTSVRTNAASTSGTDATAVPHGLRETLVAQWQVYRERVTYRGTRKLSPVPTNTSSSGPHNPWLTRDIHLNDFGHQPRESAVDGRAGRARKPAVCLIYEEFE